MPYKKKNCPNASMFRKDVGRSISQEKTQIHCQTGLKSFRVFCHVSSVCMNRPHPHCVPTAQQKHWRLHSCLAEELTESPGPLAGRGTAASVSFSKGSSKWDAALVMEQVSVLSTPAAGQQLSPVPSLLFLFLVTIIAEQHHHQRSKESTGNEADEIVEIIPVVLVPGDNVVAKSVVCSVQGVRLLLQDQGQGEDSSAEPDGSAGTGSKGRGAERTGEKRMHHSQEIVENLEGQHQDEQQVCCSQVHQEDSGGQLLGPGSQDP
ncbi:hypothetical protein LUU34_01329100 [Aix galericulata]|nr:hypothetical protein LUU34_01329100 [Aix galericulata]